MEEKKRMRQSAEPGYAGTTMDASRILTLLRPAVKQLAILHHAGRIHGAIRPEAVVIRDHLRFCFPLPEQAAKAYPAGQEAFVTLEGQGRIALWKDTEGRAGDETETDGQGTGGRAGGGTACAGQKEAGAGRSLCYIPLELLLPNGQDGARSDVYSMCAVLYQRLTGTEPPDAQSRMNGTELKPPSLLGAVLPAEAEDALMKGLSLLGKDRYSDAGELYQALYGQKRPQQNSQKLHERKQRPQLRDGWEIGKDVREIEKLWAVIFLDHIPQEAAGAWDVSQNQDGSVMAWLEHDYLYIGGEGGVMAAADSSRLFAGCAGLEVIVFQGNFDTSQTVNMSGMFFQCEKLVNMDVSGFDTSRTTDMNGMFSCCSSLTDLNLWNFDTSHTTQMYSMFSGCTSLRSLEISSFDTSAAVNMAGMFADCESLASLDVSGFHTASVKDMQMMFDDCASLTHLDVSSFDTSQVTRMYAMFSGCEKLASLDVSNFDTSHVTNMSWMFGDCASLTHLDVSSFDTSQVTCMAAMFSGCEKLTSLDVKNFDTGHVTDMGYMFYHCSSLISLDVRGFNTSQVTSMAAMFSSCEKLASLDVRNFDTGRVTDMGWMFYHCSSLTSLDVRGFYTGRTTEMQYMFAGCTSLKKLDLRNFNMSRVENSWEMIPEGFSRPAGRYLKMAGLWKRNRSNGILSGLLRQKK